MTENDKCLAVDFNLTDEDAEYIEAPYRPHEIVGANKGMQTLNRTAK